MPLGFLGSPCTQGVMFRETPTSQLRGQRLLRDPHITAQRSEVRGCLERPPQHRGQRLFRETPTAQLRGQRLFRPATTQLRGQRLCLHRLHRSREPECLGSQTVSETSAQPTLAMLIAGMSWIRSQCYGPGTERKGQWATSSFIIHLI